MCLRSVHQKLDGNCYKSAKFEEVKHLHAVSLLTAEQSRRPIRFYYKLHYISMIYMGLFIKNIKNVNEIL